MSARFAGGHSAVGKATFVCTTAPQVARVSSNGQAQLMDDNKVTEGQGADVPWNAARPEILAGRYRVLERLREIGKKRKRSVSFLIREALLQYVQDQESKDLSVD